MDYTYLKLVHLLAVMLFLGNIITGLFWMREAVKTKDLKVVSFTIRGIIRSDRYFTVPGVIVITIAGIFAARYGNFPLIRTGWILWSIILFSISGLVFGFRVAPLQKQIEKLTRVNEAEFDWMRFQKLLKAWDMWGLVATAAPLIAFGMMVLKKPL